MIRDAYPDRKRWNELKAACKERAGWRCEYVHPNGKRCSMREDEIRKSQRRRGRPYVVHLHAAHLDNKDPSNPEPELVCLCPRHHMQMDRQVERRERLSQRRRGYQITTTDALHEVPGITCSPDSENGSFIQPATDAMHVAHQMVRSYVTARLSIFCSEMCGYQALLSWGEAAMTSS